jgi:hypothetical protein
MTALHRDQSPSNGGVHVIHAFEFANSTVRNAYSYTSSDIGKIARQTDDNSFYIVLSVSPTFLQIASGGSPSGSAGGDLGGTYPNPTVTDLTIASQVQGSILYFNGSSWVQLSPGTDGYFLQTNGSGFNPEWTSTVSGSAVPTGPAGGDLSGTYPNPQVSNLTISGEQEGSILYNDGLGWIQLSPGVDGYVLTTHSTGEAPTWSHSLSLSNSLPADVDTNPASSGNSFNAARIDHKHDISTGVPGTISIGDSATEGSATSIARSDHTHALTSPAVPANVTKAAASAGAATTVARSDHKHDITTATASSIGTANAEGSSSSLARADHTHAVTDFSITSQAQGDVLFFNGSNWVRLAAGTDGYVLTTHGAGQNPTWAIDISDFPTGPAGGDLSGTYPNPEVSNLTISGEQEGSILYNDGLGWVQLSPGSDGYVLTTHGASQNPTWSINSPGNFNANVNANNWDLDNVRTVTFNQEFDNGTAGVADTINWLVAQKQKTTLSDNCTLTFIAPLGPCNLVLKVVQDGSGGNAITWPSTTRWPGGTDPTITSTGDAIDIISFYFDGTNYYGVGSLNFAA